MIRIAPGMDQVYLQYLDGQFKKSEDAQVKAGYEKSYKILRTMDDGTGWNLLILREYPSLAAIETNEEAAHPLDDWYDKRMHSLPDRLRRRLSTPLPGLAAQLRMAPHPRRWPDPGAPLRPAAALLLLYPHAGEWHLPLTVRGSALRHHTGQVSLPGGRLDHPDETVEQAALREAHEEIGVLPADVAILGRLTPLPIAVSGHMLHPVVGAAAGRPAFSLAPDEVDRLIELPVSRLLQPDAVAWEERVRSAPPAVVMNVPYFEVDGARVWGATAMVLAEFIALLDDAAR